MIPIRTSVELREAPGAVIGLIIANVAIFLLEIGLPADLAKQFIMHNALVPARYTQIGFGAAHGLEPANVFPFITNTFMHSGWWHLTINMWTLWLFGGPLEQRLGAARFVLFYLGCGVAASVAHFTFNPASPVPALGASGAIAGVLGGSRCCISGSGCCCSRLCCCFRSPMDCPRRSTRSSGSPSKFSQRSFTGLMANSRVASPGGPTSADLSSAW